MGKSRKKLFRKNFREGTFKRDQHTCKVCGRRFQPSQTDPSLGLMNAHHIWPREDMPNGGYVPENGITVCDTKAMPGQKSCHEQVEEALANYRSSARGRYPRMDLYPPNLYKLVGSDFERAREAAERL